MDYFIRPIQQKDQILFEDFSSTSILGMTNLPRNRNRFLEKITHSENSFAKDVKKASQEEYYFVLEEVGTGKISGICGILAQSTQDNFHHFKIITKKTLAKETSSVNELKFLRLIHNRHPFSEICALYLQPSLRHGGLGRLLSLSRFLFMGAFPNRFRNTIMAEMRGYIDQQQTSPFWEGIGKHFCNMSFEEIMVQIERNPLFFPEVTPTFPIYISLLPKETQESIGKIHDSTKPALNMLMNENFSFKDRVDFFEGGPILTAPKSQIRTYKESALIKIDLTQNSTPSDKKYILGNEKIDFRACYGEIEFTSKTTAVISNQLAEILMLKKGDLMRYVESH